jgi:hypothetical protein
MASANLLSSFFLLLAVSQAGHATPLAEERSMVDYPEVIPGPGFPSLASLNITSAELYQMSRADDSKPLLCITLVDIFTV